MTRTAAALLIASLASAGAIAPALAGSFDHMPEGHTNAIGTTCLGDATIEAVLDAGNKNWPVGNGDRVVIVAETRDWRIRCDNGYAGTSCAQIGHVLATRIDNAVSFACYEGDGSASPWK